MMHRTEIDTIIAQVTPWPIEERAALAYELMRDMRKQKRQPAPRRTLQRAMGIAGANTELPEVLRRSPPSPLTASESQ